MSRTVNRAIAARAAGVPYNALTQKRFHGDRPTAAPHEEGKRRAEQWSMPQILAVRVCRVLEVRFGMPVEAMTTLFNTLWLADENDLREKFASGRKFVLVVGRVPCGTCLFTSEEIADNDMLDYEAIARAGFPMPQGLDIAREYDKIVASLLLDGLNG